MPRTRNVQPRPEPAPESSGRSAVKLPLQDITDRFVTYSPVVDRLPIPRPRRRAKAPGGTFGERLAAAKTPAIPSSLPPSSPPSTSSGFPQAEYDHHVHPTSPQVPFSDREGHDSQFDLRNPDYDLAFGSVRAEEIESLDNSDPFGFFAVENKLKTLRAQKEDGKPRHRAAPSPQTDRVFSDEHQHLVTPPTPRKRHRKRRAIASPNVSSPDIFNVRTDSMPSTPSPSKPPSGKAKGMVVLIDEDNADSEAPKGESLETVTPTIASRRKPAKRACNGSTKEVESLDMFDGRRSLRRTAAVEETTRHARSGKGDHGAKSRKKGSAETGIKVPRQRTQGKGNVKSAGNTNVVDNDQRERWERERQERLEYFRKLQEYHVEKENVYVI
ncbi:hypothetical protein FPV67DRAFT_1668237 [Lyophyllum atratum]|nr:hypothetical protein FPV67DRAFT_1668237 [Lyophyllum atratum]